MKTLHITIITISLALIFPTISQAFAQEYLTVNPVFSKDQSDSCSKLEKKFPGNSYSESWATHVAINFVPTIDPNYTRTTMVDYNGTEFIITLNDYNQTIYNDYPTNTLLQSSNYTVQKTHQIILDKFPHVTIAMANVGNKSTNLYDYVYSSLVINNKDGTYITSTMTPPASMMEDQINPIMEWATYGSSYVMPGQSMGTIKSFPMNGYIEDIKPGNYTVSAVMALLGDVNGTCTRVFLWSQPVDLIVLDNTKSPEFPFAVPVLLIGVTSFIVLHRMRFNN
jgi:hypothetical protein